MEKRKKNGRFILLLLIYNINKTFPAAPLCSKHPIEAIYYEACAGQKSR